MGHINFADGTKIDLDDKVVNLIKNLMEKNKPVSSGVEHFINRFKKKYIYCDLIRIGGDGDGGYLLPDKLKDVSFCFSPGVSDVALFEQEISEKYGIKSYMADASVDKPPIDNKNFTFIPKFIGSKSEGNFITLSDWMNDCIGDDKNKKILQMDIEGGEYDVLTYEDSETLASFSTMVIEFHWLNKMFDPMFLKMISGIFEKIYRNFSICHVHPNNCCGIEVYNGIHIPRVIEVTFIRNDLVPKYLNKPITLPHKLDRKNVMQNADIIMPKTWWEYK